MNQTTQQEIQAAIDMGGYFYPRLNLHANRSATDTYDEWAALMLTPSDAPELVHKIPDLLARSGINPDDPRMQLAYWIDRPNT